MNEELKLCRLKKLAFLFSLHQNNYKWMTSYKIKVSLKYLLIPAKQDRFPFICPNLNIISVVLAIL